MFAIGTMSIQTAEAQNPVKKSNTEKVTKKVKNKKSLDFSSTSSMSKKSSENNSGYKTSKPKTTSVYSSKSKEERGSKKAKRK